jgi:N-acetylmuramoyl-L-alanine amidase
MNAIRLGAAGPHVRDVQQRLAHLGLLTDDLHGEFGPSTTQAVRTFQQLRGLVADGVVGPDTWRTLVEAGFALGDRLLYLARPMLRGDDVRELQERLNRLGFDSGQVDGIFGTDTAAAVAEFQLNVGIDPDGTAGPATMDAVRRLYRQHQAVPASDVRERHRLGQRIRRTSLAGAPIMIDPHSPTTEPAQLSPDGVGEAAVTWAIATRVAGRLAALGARPILSRGPATAPSLSDRAAMANRESVEAILSIHTNGLDSATAWGAAAYYFGSAASVSEDGRHLADRCLDHLCERTGTPNCRAHPSSAGLLRESRAVAVIVEVGFLTHPEEGRRLNDPDYQAVVAGALTDALTEFLLE